MPLVHFQLYSLIPSRYSFSSQVFIPGLPFIASDHLFSHPSTHFLCLASYGFLRPTAGDNPANQGQLKRFPEIPDWQDLPICIFLLSLLEQKRKWGRELYCQPEPPLLVHWFCRAYADLWRLTHKHVLTSILSQWCKTALQHFHNTMGQLWSGPEAFIYVCCDPKLLMNEKVFSAFMGYLVHEKYICLTSLILHGFHSGGPCPWTGLSRCTRVWYIINYFNRPCYFNTALTSSEFMPGGSFLATDFYKINF